MSKPNKDFIAEEQLIALLKSKDSKGISYLYDKYSAALYGTAYRIVQNQSFAEEVMQDALMNIWNKIDSYDPKKARLFTWMLNIVRNKAIDKVRSAEVRRENKSDSINDVVSILDKAGEYEQNTDAIGLQEIVNTLNEDQKFVLEMIYYKGYTHAELSKEFEIPLGTVKTRLRSAINLLRDRMNVN
ncbi:RNA polymerase sigma factor [Reichenbachiella ulvae]|uniref:Sigma-70 family RNA polymerase sigma factor n=1 Tax=Reichenbachiella ulvae TaxID=2980104 RepID=A0ABT3CXJ6_9BACT|nr:sigma-70 family RNA polymerase sigma factor [Reichenbachiella ulvae]MCV9388420.1 sigma-70 family RNA polymerase sigma factor [Reichenbachiella ulvae]